jgi:hypothetical protein
MLLQVAAKCGVIELRNSLSLMITDRAIYQFAYGRAVKEKLVKFICLWLRLI